MFNILRRIPKSRLAFIGFFGPSSPDVVKTPGYQDLDKKYTGMEALKRMFQPDEYGEISAELIAVLHMSTASCLMGIVYGAITQGRVAFTNFIENNQATQFANHLDAKKKLQDKVTLAMGRGALKWGTKIGLFSSMFIALHTCIRVYRGEPGIVEYIAAGAITGGLFRLNLGPKGLFVGSLVGTIVGTLAGSVSQGFLYMTGYTMQDIEKAQQKFHNDRNEAIRYTLQAMNQTESEMKQIKEARQMEKDQNKLPLDNVPEVMKK